MNKRAWACCKYSLRKLLSSPRLWVLAILCLLCCDRCLSPILDLAKGEGLPVGWVGLSACLLDDPILSAMMALGLLMLLYDVSKQDGAQKYLMLRAGRRAWARGQLLCILSITALYMLCLGLILFIWIAPHIDWSLGWSPMIERIASGTLEASSIVDCNPRLLSAYSAPDALGIMVLLRYLCLITLSMLMALLSGAIGSRAAFIAAAIPVAADCAIDAYLPIAAYYFSPVTLSRLSCLYDHSGTMRPSLLYACVVLIALAVGLGMLFTYIYERKELRQ